MARYIRSVRCHLPRWSVAGLSPTSSLSSWSEIIFSAHGPYVEAATVKGIVDQNIYMLVSASCLAEYSPTWQNIRNIQPPIFEEISIRWYLFLNIYPAADICFSTNIQLPIFEEISSCRHLFLNKYPAADICFSTNIQLLIFVSQETAADIWFSTNIQRPIFVSQEISSRRYLFLNLQLNWNCCGISVYQLICVVFLLDLITNTR